MAQSRAPHASTLEAGRSTRRTRPCCEPECGLLAAGAVGHSNARRVARSTAVAAAVLVLAAAGTAALMFAGNDGARVELAGGGGRGGRGGGGSDQAGSSIGSIEDQLQGAQQMFDEAQVRPQPRGPPGGERWRTAASAAVRVALRCATESVC